MIDSSMIRKEDLNPIYQDISQVIGLDSTIKLGLEFGGENIYFPRLDRGAGALVKARDREIVKEYAMGNITVAKLARKYDLSQRRVFYILKRDCEK